MSKESNIAEYKMIQSKNIGFYLVTGLFVLICVSLLFVDTDIYPDDRLSNIIWNLGHVGLFSVILWVVTTASPKLLNFPVTTVLPIALICVAIVSIPIELFQESNGRDADLTDIYRNCLGAALVIIFRSKGYSLKFKLLKPASRLFASLLLTVVLYPLFINTADTYWGYRSFPVLADFESPFELTRWSGPKLKIKELEGGNQVLIANFTTNLYSSLSLNSFSNDWSRYNVLSFRLFNPYQSTHQLTLRIHDKQHYLSGWSHDDRFHQELEAKSGWNDYSINLSRVKLQPKTRDLNMSQIGSLMIFTRRLPEKATFYFDDFRLHN